MRASRDHEAGNDESHLRPLAAGDAQAFEVLFERHVDFVHNFLFRRTASWSVAEDLTEVVFLELWRQRARVVTQAGSLRPWLVGVASNLVRHHWRGLSRLSAALARLGGQRSSDGDVAETVVGRLDDERRMLTLLAALKQLPAGQREVLTLWAWEQLTYEEIAAALDLPVGTVRSRLSRARAALRAVDGTPSEPRASTAAERGGTAS